MPGPFPPGCEFRNPRGPSRKRPGTAHVGNRASAFDPLSRAREDDPEPVRNGQYSSIGRSQTATTDGVLCPGEKNSLRDAARCPVDGKTCGNRGCLPRPVISLSKTQLFEWATFWREAPVRENIRWQQKKCVVGIVQRVARHTKQTESPQQAAMHGRWCMQAARF